MKKLLLLLLLTLGVFSSYGSEKVNVFIQPSSPIVNEPFDLIFKIQLSGDEDPYISFDPGRFEVLGKSNQGVSIKTTILNGKFATKKEVNIVYSVQSQYSGQNYIRNIEVDFGGGKKEKLKNLSINVLKEPQRAKDIFVLAVPSKTDVYVGEGFDVNYYLYFKIGVLGSEVEKYPTLSKFLKRFHIVNEVVETVRYQGEMYRRTLKYSARLFAQKPGEATIDPLKLKVQYASSRNRGAFGFGLQLGQYRTRSFNSSKVKINVMSLPSENVPPYFTGLVGKHEFNLTVPRNKFLVNEAIEAKLEVKGVGALEAFDPPKIFSHESLEEFDTKGEIQPVDKQVQKKIFEYTFLPRAGFKLEPSTTKVAYFDPDQNVYVTTEIPVPEMIVSGANTTARSFTRPEVSAGEDVKDEKPQESIPNKGIVGIGLGKSVTSSLTPLRLNISLVMAIILVVISFFITGKKSSNENIKRLVKEAISKNCSYSTIYALINYLPGDEQKTATEKLGASSLSDQAKDHLLMLLDALERGTYSEGIHKTLKVNRKHINELRKLIE
ncbi:BatD family protein [Halobacteriovorax sp. HLS]|uniref:BatD family protein n=1 Tax=Halobacteriovorax sp. HLS TaxID=2234000 RepID=UPI000FD7B402|nr:BatD family protein [Halobacteriovorax sp. HLS]